MIITESIIEQATLDWFKGLGYSVLNGTDIAPGELFSERTSCSDVILEGRVRSALTNINPRVTLEAIEDAYRKLTITIHESHLLAANNHRFHKMLTDGIDVEYKNSEGRIVGDKVWLIDFDNPYNNDWLAVNQFTVIEGQSTPACAAEQSVAAGRRRPDIVVFINGIPIGVIELKNPSDENATIKDAFNQLQTYKKEITSLFPYNEILIVSNGIEARAGTLTANWEWFLPWRTIEGEDVAFKGLPELEVLIKGIFEKNRFLDLIRYFIVFEVDGSESMTSNALLKTAQLSASIMRQGLQNSSLRKMKGQRSIQNLRKLQREKNRQQRKDSNANGHSLRRWLGLKSVSALWLKILSSILKTGSRRWIGKGMIVCMSRRICVDLYNALIKLRPEWHSEDDDEGFLKVVMTGSASDPAQWQEHIRNKNRRERLAKTFSKKPDHPIKLVIVRDMWLTGFDVPSLHTMYVDKPMRGHGLMQAIARVNRVFKDKPGGLVVDYFGIADELKKALSDYTDRDRDMTGIPQEEAVAVMLEKYEIVSAMFHGFDYRGFFFSNPSESRVTSTELKSNRKLGKTI